MFVMLPVPPQYSVHERQKVSNTISNITAPITTSSRSAEQTSIDTAENDKKNALRTDFNFLLSLNSTSETTKTATTETVEQQQSIFALEPFYLEKKETKLNFLNNHSIIKSIDVIKTHEHIQQISAALLKYSNDKTNKFYTFFNNKKPKTNSNFISQNNYNNTLNKKILKKAIASTIQTICKYKLGSLIILKSNQQIYSIDTQHLLNNIVNQEVICDYKNDYKRNAYNFNKQDLVSSNFKNSSTFFFNFDSVNYSQNNNSAENSIKNFNTSHIIHKNHINKFNCKHNPIEILNNSHKNGNNLNKNNNNNKFSNEKDINNNNNKIKSKYYNNFNTKIFLKNNSKVYNNKNISNNSIVRKINQNKLIKKNNNTNIKIKTDLKIILNKKNSTVENKKPKITDTYKGLLPYNIDITDNLYLIPENIQQILSGLTEELNNLKNILATVQIPVATIFNHLYDTEGVIKVKQKKNIVSMNPMTQKELPGDSPDLKAMRYYRLWIYTCNAALLIGVVIFCGAAGKVLMAEYKRLLISDLNLSQPSFIYAYLALLMQSGFLQLIGCLGALRLSEKLLNTYLLLLLLLLIGDVLLGIFWMFKFDKIMETFEPILRNKLNTDYGSSNEFTYLWNRLQIDGKCCGILGAQDFLNKSFLSSCCDTGLNSSEHISVSRKLLASALVFRSEDLVAQQTQKPNVTNLVDSPWSHVVLGTKYLGVSGTDISNTSNDTVADVENTNGLKLPTANTETNKNISTCKNHIKHGCRDFIAEWLRNTADILFVIGYCVITFLKLSFLGILRYEIREMIQKIRLLQNENAAALALAEQELNQNNLTQVTSSSINGGLHTITEAKIGNHDREKERSRISFAESERESLLVKEVTPLNYMRKKNLYGCSDFGGASCTADNSKGACLGEIAAFGNSFECAESNYNNMATGGIESFNNSSSAGNRMSLAGMGGASSSGLRIQDSTSAAAAAVKSLNSNNYELNEFDTKPPKYRGGYNNCSNSMGRSSSTSIKMTSTGKGRRLHDKYDSSNTGLYESRCETSAELFEHKTLRKQLNSLQSLPEFEYHQHLLLDQSQQYKFHHFTFDESEGAHWQNEANTSLLSKENFNNSQNLENEKNVETRSKRSEKSIEAQKAFISKSRITTKYDSQSFGELSTEFLTDSCDPNLLSDDQNLIKNIRETVNITRSENMSEDIKSENVTTDSLNYINESTKNIVFGESDGAIKIEKTSYSSNSDLDINNCKNKDYNKFEKFSYNTNQSDYSNNLSYEVGAKNKIHKIHNNEHSKYNYNFYNDKRQQFHRNNENCCCCCNNSNFDQSSGSGQDI